MTDSSSPASSSSSSLLANVLGSATAGIIARVFTHPLDTAKARLQATTGQAYKGPLDVLVQTARREGLQGLYRGFGAVTVGGTPGTVLYLCSYDLAKDYLSSNPSDNNDTTTKQQQQSSSLLVQSLTQFATYFCAGMVAEAVACIVYVPVDVVKERLQVQRASDTWAYKGSWDAVKVIATKEGVGTLYKGYGATLLSFGTYSGLFFVCYEQLLATVRRQLRVAPDEPLPAHWTLLCSCGGGAVASWLTSPLDMAKLRLQVQRGQQQQHKQHAAAAVDVVTYRNMWDCLRQIYQQGGVAGLFRGAGARVLHFAPTTTITITSYEVCRAFFANLL